MNNLIDKYLATCTPFEQKIAKHLLKLIKNNQAKRNNIIVAREVGCNVVTVLRATKKFHDDGFIIKCNNPGIPNTYVLNKKFMI